MSTALFAAIIASLTMLRASSFDTVVTIFLIALPVTVAWALIQKTIKVFRGISHV
jgi:ABC-type uncharacterized transport system permease subunit